MAFLFLLFVGVNLIKGERRWQIARWLAIVLIATAILLTRERTPIAMIGVGVVVLMVLRFYPSYSRIFLVIGLVVTLLAVSTFIQANRSFVIRLLGGDLASIRLVELANPFQANTVVWRIDVKWIPALQMMDRNPIGYGLGATRYSRVNRDGNLLIAPHNTFLEIGLETGIPGLLLFFFIGLEFMRWTFILKSQCRPIRSIRFMPDALLAVFTSALACALVSTVLLDTASLLVWLIIGITPVINRLVVQAPLETI
jgi:O-antigen ligase